MDFKQLQIFTILLRYYQCTKVISHYQLPEDRGSLERNWATRIGIREEALESIVHAEGQKKVLAIKKNQRYYFLHSTFPSETTLAICRSPWTTRCHELSTSFNCWTGRSRINLQIVDKGDMVGFKAQGLEYGYRKCEWRSFQSCHRLLAKVRN